MNFDDFDFDFYEDGDDDRGSGVLPVRDLQALWDACRDLRWAYISNDLRTERSFRELVNRIDDVVVVWEKIVEQRLERDLR